MRGDRCRLRIGVIAMGSLEMKKVFLTFSLGTIRLQLNPEVPEENYFSLLYVLNLNAKLDMQGKFETPHPLSPSAGTDTAADAKRIEEMGWTPFGSGAHMRIVEMQRYLHYIATIAYNTSVSVIQRNVPAPDGYQGVAGDEPCIGNGPSLHGKIILPDTPIVH